MLEIIHTDDKDKSILNDIYYQQEAAVKQNDRLSNWQKIKRCTRQGCPASVDLLISMANWLTVSWKSVLKELLSTAVFWIIRLYNPEECPQNLHDLRAVSVKQGLEINPNKTTNSSWVKCHFTCDNQEIDQVDSFNYLGFLVKADGRCEKEIRCPICLAEDGINRFRKTCTDKVFC